MPWFDGPYTETFEDEFHRIMRRIRKDSQATVVHHETCPCCGAKLVNLYRRDKKGGPRMVTEWKCRRCWEKYDADPPAMKLGSGKIYMVDKDGNHTLLGEVKEPTPAFIAARRILEREAD